MSAAYEPATMAVATVRGVEGVHVMRTDGTTGADTVWVSVAHVKGSRNHAADQVADIRPLVVLDLDGIDLVQLRHSLARWKSWSSMTSEQAILTRLLDQIEAQTKPPRIPEPGLWGVVEADANPAHRSQLTGLKRWVRIEAGWCSSDDVDTVAWDVLIDPALIREGVES